MRQAIIKDGIVVNICVGEAGGITIPDDSPVAIGWSYADGVFSPPAVRAADVQEKIDALERRELLPRPVRIFMLEAAIERAAAAGYTEPQLYAANYTYKRVKDFDAQITALRLQQAAL